MNSTPEVLRQHLRNNFDGLNDFRGVQLPVIGSILNGKYTIMHSATGSGKSLVYLFLASYCRKSVIVITPLRSVCFAQVRTDHPVADPNSNLSILHECFQGRSKILFVSPEFFVIHECQFYELMKQLK